MAQCTGYSAGGIAPHAADPADFNTGKTRCKRCTSRYYADWRASGGTKRPRRKPFNATAEQVAERQRAADAIAAVLAAQQAPEAAAAIAAAVAEPERPAASYAVDTGMTFGPALPVRDLPEFTTASGHKFRPDPDLVDLWDRCEPGDHLIFLGPSGCGKTEAAEYLAHYSGMPLVKVDCAAMTDPEAFFGTREVVVENGQPVTKYHPSAFVSAIQQPVVLQLDEFNRTQDSNRNILLPLLDSTAQVTNPLSGEVVKRHPECRIILTGNRGVQHTGVYAVDVAFTTRALVVEFDYAEPEVEAGILQDAHGITITDARQLVAFAADTRLRAAEDDEFHAVSTRELLKTAKQIAKGSDAGTALKYAVFNATEPHVRAQLAIIWDGFSNGSEPKIAADPDAPCAFGPEQGALPCNIPARNHRTTAEGATHDWQAAK